MMVRPTGTQVSPMITGLPAPSQTTKAGHTQPTKKRYPLPPENMFGLSWADLLQATVLVGPRTGRYSTSHPNLKEISKTYQKLDLSWDVEPETPNKNQTESNKLSLAKYKIKVNSTVYIAKELANGQAIITNPSSQWTSSPTSYSWKSVLSKIDNGYWKLLADITPKEPGNSNILDTPEKVEIGDTIVFFASDKGVETRRKGVVASIYDYRALGGGRFTTKDDKVIDIRVNSNDPVTGLYVVDKAAKPKVETAADKPVGTIMSYTRDSGAKFTNIKTTPERWSEIAEDKIYAAGLSNEFIDSNLKEFKGEYLFVPSK